MGGAAIDGAALAARVIAGHVPSASRALRALEDESPGFLGRDRQDVIERHYIVSTKRYGSGGRWEGEVIDVANNVAILMPEEVLDGLNQQRESILKSQRQDIAEETAAKRRALGQEAA